MKNPYRPAKASQAPNSTSDKRPSNTAGSLLVAAAAAFCVYFCMYAFRKPFTAATFDNQAIYGLGLKTVLVISQLLGYTVSKFVGVKIVSEMREERRALTIVVLIVVAELALVGFAVAPVQLKVLMLFCNGLPLGMVFGLVLAYLEGRKQTEALSAALCASFIVSSGVVKSVGRWLIQDWGVGEFEMPMVAGLIFLPPLLVSVWMLQKTPPPDPHDRVLRSERTTLDAAGRRDFVAAYWPGLVCLILVYIAVTVVRTVRDDFAVEIWRDMGVDQTPSVFARSETVVAICVTALNAMAIWITVNLAAIRITLGMMCCAFALVLACTLGQSFGTLSPFVFMVACGVGLYVPYVAFHTTIFERLIAASRRPCNLGFLMYLADSIGYLGYAVVIVLRTSMQEPGRILPFFLASLVIVAVVSIGALLVAWFYFQRTLSDADVVEASMASTPT